MNSLLKSFLLTILIISVVVGIICFIAWIGPMILLVISGIGFFGLIWLFVHACVTDN